MDLKPYITKTYAVPEKSLTLFSTSNDIIVQTRGRVVLRLTAVDLELVEPAHEIYYCNSH